MGLYKNWLDLIQNQTDETFGEFWEEYSEGETKIYKDILDRKENIFKGKISELAEKYEVRAEIFMGFLDGINTSIKEEQDLDKLMLDSDIKLDIDFEKLLFNMFVAKADYLYTLKEWEGIFSEEKYIEIYDNFRRSRTVVKGEKIGRNDPCPCGSGKKYKKCCGK